MIRYSCRSEIGSFIRSDIIATRSGPILRSIVGSMILTCFISMRVKCTNIYINRMGPWIPLTAPYKECHPAYNSLRLNLPGAKVRDGSPRPSVNAQSGTWKWAPCLLPRLLQRHGNLFHVGWKWWSHRPNPREMWVNRCIYIILTNYIVTVLLLLHGRWEANHLQSMLPPDMHRQVPYAAVPFWGLGNEGALVCVSHLPLRAQRKAGNSILCKFPVFL